MRRLTLVLGLALSVPACSTCSPVAPPDAGDPPFELGLTLNDATSTTLVAGWPVALRLHGAWMTDATQPVRFEASELALTVQGGGGGPAGWPFALATTLPPSTALGPDSPLLEVAWTLSAAQAVALAPGRYTLRASWGATGTGPLEVEVVPAPATLSPQQRADLARLTADVAFLRGDARAALAAAEEGLAAAPGDAALLGAKAAAHEALGELEPALGAARAALARLGEAYPDGTPEPSLTLLEAQRRVQDRLLFPDGGR